MKHSFSKSQSRVSTLIVIFLTAVVALVGAMMPVAFTSGQASDAAIQIAAADAVTVHATGRGGSLISLQDGRDVPTVYAGAESLKQVLRKGSAQPLALASADFDADSAPDLAAGYASAGGGIISLHRGNIEAIAPQSKQSLKEIKKGRFPAPFLEGATAFEVADAPAFLAAGDFNRDGREDLVFAARGGNSLHFLLGDGRGAFAPAQAVALSGQVTALASGDVNRRDGAPDLVVAVASGQAAAILVYEGHSSILQSEPASYALSAGATALALGALDDDNSIDIAAAAGREAIIIHGRTSEHQASIERIGFSFALSSIAIGDFIPDRGRKMELAVMSADGAIQLMARGALDTNPMSKEERLAYRVQHMIESGQPVSKRLRERFGKEAFADMLAQAAGDAGAWMVAENIRVGARSTSRVAPQNALMRANISSQPADDLLVLDAENNRLHIVPFAGERTQAAGDVYTRSLSSGRADISLDVEGAPVAALPMRLNVDTLTDLVVLRQGEILPTALVGTAAATFTVDRTDDDALATACTAAPNDCSLRGAIIAANTAAGADTIIVPAGTYTLTLGPADDEENFDGARADIGDLDILSGDVTIVGDGAGVTIIQAGATTATAIDRIFDVNNFAGPGIAVNVSMSGVTLRHGRAPTGLFGTFLAGGAIQFDSFTPSGPMRTLSISSSSIVNNEASGSGGGVFAIFCSASFTSVDVSSNTTIHASGGGISYDGGARNASQTLQVSGSTVTGNTAIDPTFGSGAGIHASGGQGVTVQNSTVANNVAAANGGGINIANSPNVIITGGSISGNSANGDGGAIHANVFNAAAGLPSTMTVTGAAITGNSADDDANGSGNGGGIFLFRGTLDASNSSFDANSAASGGGIAVGAGSSLNASENTFTANSASNQGGGVYNLGTITANFNRFFGNTATDATSSGLRNSSIIVSLANNWWGCNGDPATAAACDRVAGTSGAHNPRLVLTHTASPTTINVGGSATLTASFLTNSDGNPVSPSDLDALIGVPVTFGNAVNGTISAAQPTIQPSGTATATFTGTASGTGSADATVDNATVTATVTILAPPAITCPANVTVSNNPNQCGAVVIYPAPTATGSPAPTVTCSPASGAFFPVGTTTVTCTASNGSGSDATCSFTVTVNDTQPPSVTCPADITVASAAGQCGAVVSYPAPTATDNCPGVTVTCSPASGAFYATGTTTVTCTAVDAHNNSSTCSFTITVNDTQPPSITCPAPITVSTAPGSCSAVVSFNVAATDNCPGVTVVSSPASGSVFPKGTTTVTATATDASGNTTTCTFTVTVLDVQPPSIVCPANITTNTDPGQCSAVVSYTVSASDNCGAVTVASNPPSGATFPVGTTTVTVVATDTSGNSSSCTFTVTVNNSAENVAILSPPSGTLYQAGSTVNFVATFSGNAADIQSAQWAFTSNVLTLFQAGVVDGTTNQITASQTFAHAGVYLVTLTVTDVCGNTTVIDTVGGLTAMVVVYDPEAGFVTGGGWINSPAGAYTPDPSLTGKASFGFVSKYKPGRSTPDGNTEFQFRAASLNFKSTNYDFLVISGAKITLKGTGTINGQGGYEFTLTAIDGQTNGGGGQDRFRIRIRNSSNQVIYDNELTRGENDDPTTGLGGGSIVIHQN